MKKIYIESQTAYINFQKSGEVITIKTTYENSELKDIDKKKKI
jgi:hypothetical protein